MNKLRGGFLVVRLRNFSHSGKDTHKRAFSSSKPDKRIVNLIRTNRISEARTVFEELKKSDIMTWNSMISGYVKRREMGNARELFNKMPNRDVVSWNLMISGYVSCRGSRFLEEGRQLFDVMPERDCVSWNTMISGYAKNGRMEEALRLFHKMPAQNVVSWNAIVSGFLYNGDVVQATEYFERMPERDNASLSALVSGLIRNGELDEAASVLVKFGNKFDGREDLVHAYDTLIAGYGQRGRVVEARKLFDQIPASKKGRFRRSIVSWNSMIMAYVKVRDVISARELFDQMRERDTFSWNTIISGYTQVLDMNEASKLFSLMPNPDTFSWNSMITGYAQMGDLELALDFFERTPEKNLVSWNSVIAGCEENHDYRRAIKLFTQMLAEGEKPDRHTLSSALSLSTGIVDLYLGMQIHQMITKTVIPDLPINNALITMYSRCGEISEAQWIFDDMKHSKNVITWNAMIGGYTSHGLAAEALHLFKLMISCKVLPTHITFVSVLSACAHAGLIKEGLEYFNSMVHEYGIMPRIEHYANLVDIVSRHGQIEEAMDIIRSMPFEPDKSVWGAILGACRTHNNVDLARVAAEALMKLEPESSTPYVILCNMYADAGRWDEASNVRTLMKSNKIKKPAGYSRVDSSLG